MNIVLKFNVLKWPKRSFELLNWIAKKNILKSLAKFSWSVWRVNKNYELINLNVSLINELRHINGTVFLWDPKLE